MPESPHSSFFPFDPTRLRLGAFFAAVASAVLSASALASARAAREPQAWVRASVCCALMIGFATLFVRLRSRPGWGVTLGPLGLVISRPLVGETQLAWSQVSLVRRDGERLNRFGVFAKDGTVQWLNVQLFRDRATFDAMAAAVSSQVTPPLTDA